MKSWASVVPLARETVIAQPKKRVSHLKTILNLRWLMIQARVLTKKLCVVVITILVVVAIFAWLDTERLQTEP